TGWEFVSFEYAPLNEDEDLFEVDIYYRDLDFGGELVGEECKTTDLITVWEVFYDNKRFLTNIEPSFCSASKDAIIITQQIDRETFESWLLYASHPQKHADQS